jgi:acetamidase/formamidase
MREIHQPEGAFCYTFGPHHAPVATVQPGETVVVYTVDALGDLLVDESQRPSDVLGPYLNPQTGPLYIEGAEAGDTLAVTILDIEPLRDTAVSCTIPYFGGLTSTASTASLQEPLEERTWIYHRQPDGSYRYRDRWSIPWRPFYGTFGVSPQIESIASLTPGSHGGNMDVPDVTIGNTVMFPVRVPGALFFTGDCHANQGEGELCGVALEIAAKGTLRFDLIRGKSIEWPRIENDEKIMVVGSAKPMEDAARIAYAQLVGWLVDDYGFEKLDAYQLLTQAGELYVGNMVDPNYSLVASVKKSFLAW